MSQDEAQEQQPEEPLEEVQVEEPEPEVAPEAQPEPEPTILTREELMVDYKDKATSRVIHGFRVRGLSGVEQQRVDAARLMALSDAKPNDRLAESRIATMRATLQGGVIEPRLNEQEWMYILKEPGRARQLYDVLTVIQELSGIGDPEVELAKKVFAQMQITSEDSTQP